MNFDKDIANLLLEQHVFSLATSFEAKVWQCSCFYACWFDVNSSKLIFTSSHDTRHVQEFLKNPNVAVNVYYANENPSLLYGVQMSGVVSALTEFDIQAKKAYVDRFSFVEGITDLPLWFFSIQYAKMTDNRIHFGYKKIWDKNDSSH